MKINEVENRKTIKEISENRTWFLGRSTEMETFRQTAQEKKTPVQTGNERVGMHMDLIEIKKIISQ